MTAPPRRTLPQPSTAFTLADQRQMTRARNYFAWQSRLILQELGRRVVEVGCGIGNFTELLLDREVVVALDSEAACVEVLRQRFPNRGNLHALTCDASGPAFRELAQFQPDSCICVNVLEHIEDDQQALETMASILAPGGVIVLLVPAFEALYGPIDRNLGHYRRYNRTSLQRLAAAAGLQVRKLRYWNFIGYFGWWVNAHVLRREAQSDRQIAIFDRCLVPLFEAIENAAPPPFGQSLLAVLRKTL
ncbi:MAG TPA: class I SAM-dependent methyltransferase [Bryobacteraceae bacterium]|nr:class I SAM-dependent methyltransferase [Bryobacteraceae bacterium]